MPSSSSPHPFRRALPPVATTTAVGCALVVATLPSLLPRSALTQGLLSATLVLVALAVVAVGRRVVRAVRGRRDPAPAARAVALVVVSGVVIAALVAGQVRESVHATEVGLAPAPWSYWFVAAAWALLAVGAAAALTGAARHTLRRAGRPGRQVAGVLLVATVTSAAAPTGLLEPLRKDLAPDHPMLTVSPLGATRAFARVGEADGPEDVAALAVDRLVEAGGLGREAVVVVVPVGSGWVNEVAVEAVETELGGDVAVVSAQYSDLPSWYQYLFDRDPALRSATALLAGVLDEVDDLPEERRPDVYVYGESLGAQVGQAAVRQVPVDRVCGVVWSGAPGATLTGHPHERSLLNDDDPIRYLTAGTALRRPEAWPTVWVPLLSWGTTWLDTSTSLGPKPGHGHQYGAEQDWSLPVC